MKKQSIHEKPKVRSVRVEQVIIIETIVGDGKDTALRPFRQFFDMQGNEIEAGDYLK